jgi:hypothetical protein
MASSKWKKNESAPMIEKLNAYNGDTEELRLYNRDAGNEVGFRTTRLTVAETHALTQYCAKLYRDAFNAGQRNVAYSLENILRMIP